MTSPNNERITANDGEKRQHRDKSYKRATSKLRRQHGKELVKDQQQQEESNESTWKRYLGFLSQWLA